MPKNNTTIVPNSCAELFFVWQICIKFVDLHRISKNEIHQFFINYSNKLIIHN